MLKHGRYGEAIKTARAKLAERFGAYNGHPYPFMLLPPNFPPVLRRGRPYNTDACIEFTKKERKRKKEKRNSNIARYSSILLLRIFVHLSLV